MWQPRRRREPLESIRRLIGPRCVCRGGRGSYVIFAAVPAPITCRRGRTTMTVLALIAALILEQIRPLDDRAALSRPMAGSLDFIEHNLNAGAHHHGTAAWLITVLPLLIASVAIYYLLYQVSGVLAWAWNVAVLYLTMGFRQFSHHFTDIHKALDEGDLPRARLLTRAWRGRPADDLNTTEVARVAI